MAEEKTVEESVEMKEDAANKAAAKSKKTAPKKDAKKPDAPAKKKGTKKDAKSADVSTKKKDTKKAKDATGEKADAATKKESEKKPKDKKRRVKIKPELSEETVKLLDIRYEISHRRPRFRRQEWFRYKRLGIAWRKPRGLHSKTRANWSHKPPLVSAGYGGPKQVSGYHPSGFKEVMVHNPKDLETVNPKVEAARIGHSVGTRKRMDIEERAEELGIRVLNRRV